MQYIILNAEWSLRVLLQKYTMHYTLVYITSNGYGRGEGGNSLVIFYLSAQRSITYVHCHIVLSSEENCVVVPSASPPPPPDEGLFIKVFCNP